MMSAILRILRIAFDLGAWPSDLARPVWLDLTSTGVTCLPCAPWSDLAGSIDLGFCPSDLARSGWLDRLGVRCNMDDESTSPASSSSPSLSFVQPSHAVQPRAAQHLTQPGSAWPSRTFDRLCVAVSAQAFRFQLLLRLAIIK